MIRSLANVVLPALRTGGACTGPASHSLSVGVENGLLGALRTATNALKSGISPDEPAALHSSSHACHSPSPASPSDETISVTYIDKDDAEHTVNAPIGKNLLEVAHDNEIDLEGACEASLACSTCHVIVENEEYFKRIPEADEDELDMLDLAFGLTETSRLGCQVIATKELDGLRVRIPSASRNFYVDGHKPKPH